MSSSHKLIFAQEAVDDIDQILQFTAEEWGSVAQEKYAAILEQAFRRITSFPESGVRRMDAGTQVRCVIAGQHLVLYQIDDDIISIRRVVHQHIGELPIVDD